MKVHTSRIPAGVPEFDVDEQGEIRRHRAMNLLETRLGVPVPFLAAGTTRAISRAAESADVVVAHGHVYPMSVAAMRAARRLGKPFVLVQHNPWIEYPAPLAAAEWSADRLIGRRVISSAQLVVCVSAYTEEYVRGLAPDATTAVIHNGVDMDVFRPHDRPTHTRREFVCVRRLVPRNGVDVLIDAWRLAGLEERDLVIIGDGVDAERLKSRAADLPNVRFEGVLSLVDLVERMAGAYATVVPTRSGEGFGLVAAESQSCGVPVIAAAQGALPEVVLDDVNGLTFAPGDAADLAQQLVRMSTDPDLRDRLAQGAAGMDWSWDRVGDQLDRYLCNVVDGHS